MDWAPWGDAVTAESTVATRHDVRIGLGAPDCPVLRASEPPGIQPCQQVGDLLRLFRGEVAGLSRVVGHVVELDDTVGDVAAVGDDQLPVAGDDPAIPETRGRIVDIRRIVGEDLAEDRLAAGNGFVVEEVDALSAGLGFDSGCVEDGGGDVDRADG